MPELPEVETTVRGLKPIINSSILNIKINTPKLRFLIPKSILLIKEGTTIKDIKRRGKFIIIYLSNNHSIVLHLGMSGRLRLFKPNKYHKEKHDHFILVTNNQHLVVFNDVRKFGFIDFDKIDNIHKRKYILNLGFEALSSYLDGKLLLSKISKTIVPIKQILLDQRIIAGIGNIYASELLFDARISPFVRGKNLNLKQCNKIINSTKKILKKAIKAGGSTLKDYVSTDGTVGNFQNKFKVYNRAGKRVNGQLIKKVVQYGRSTYYCPEIQKFNSF
jgi:formamidopyrimidine-DNA glycosylase